MFNLAALGAGIGQGVDQIRQQQESQLRMAQARLAIQRFAEEQKQLQQQNQAKAMLFSGLLSGGLGNTQTQPIGGQTLPPAGVGGGGGQMMPGGALTGGADPRGLAPFIRERAANYHIDPNVALAVFRSEGLGNPVGDKGTSFGAPQLHVGGGLGDVFQKETGLDPRNWQQNERQMIDWSLRRIATHPTEGWTPYHGAARVGIGPRQGIGVGGSADLATGTGDFAIPSYGEAPAVGAPDTLVASQGEARATPASYDPTGGSGRSPIPPWIKRNSRGEPYNLDDAPGQQISASQVTPQRMRDLAAAQVGLRGSAGATPTADPMAPVQHEVRQTVQQAAQITPPQVFGRMGLQSLAQQIEKANPGADPVVKMMALEEAQKLLAPDARMQWELYKQQHDEAFQRDMVRYRAQVQREEGGASKLLEDEEGNLHEWHQGQPIPKGLHEPGASKAQGQPFQDPATGKWFQITTKGDVREVALPAGAVKPGGAGQQIPPELQYPEKWDGMPNKAPPGVRQDVWQASMEYVRTGKMPSLGFQPGMRNLVMQASPAAAHALGVEPAKVADLQAQYAGMRHAQIVGGGRAAQIELGVQEAVKAAPQVIETSKAVPRTQFPSANALGNWLQSQGGSPQIVAFREALNTYLNVYASVVSRTGRLTDAQQKHAYELLSTSMNQGQIERGIQQLDYEMQLMKEAVPEAMGQLGGLGAPPALRQPSTAAPTPQQQNAKPSMPSWASDAATSQDGRTVYYDRQAGRWVDENRQPVQ